MIEHLKFKPGTKLLLTITGAGVGTILGMLKANTVEDTVNRFIDMVNETAQTLGQN